MFTEKLSDELTGEEQERDRRHKAFDTIMSCPYDDLKIILSDTLDALLALRSARIETQDVDHFIELFVQDRK